MFETATVSILVSMGMALTRALKGPLVFDRILGANMFGTKTVLLIGVRRLSHRSAGVSRSGRCYTR